MLVNQGPHHAPSVGFRRDIAGLRALAVLLVVLFHSGVPGLTGGFIGVDVFFVLSGFLIFGLLLTEAQTSGRISIIKFYARRARRILPAAILVLLTTVVVAQLALNPIDAGSVAADARWVALFAGNLHFSQVGTDYFASGQPPSPLQHYWSLAVEEQFYLVVPLLMAGLALLRPIRPRATLFVFLSAATTASLAWSVIATHTSATAAYFSAATRAFELTAGGALAAATPLLQRAAARGRRRNQRVALLLGVLGLSGIAAAATLFSPATAFPGIAAALPVAATMAVLAAGILGPGTAVPRVLSFRPLQAGGSISYSLYLWHWPLLVIAADRAGHPLSVGTGLTISGASVILAALTYGLVENPWRRAAALVGRPAISLAAGGALLLTGFTVPAIASQVTRETPAAQNLPAAVPVAPVAPLKATSPFLMVKAAVQRGAVLHSLPSRLRVPLPLVPKDHPVAYDDNCTLRQLSETSPLCAYGDKTSPTVVLLFGDSHAAQWLPALAAVGQRAHLKVVLLTKSGCPLPAIRTYDRYDRHEYFTCEAFHRIAIRQIAQLHPAFVVMSNQFANMYGRPSPAQAQRIWLAGLTPTLRQVVARAGHVFYLRDTPLPASNPVECLSSHPRNISSCRTAVSSAIHRADGFEARIQALTQRLGVTYVNTTSWFCTPTTCPDISNDTSIFSDSNHMSAAYSLFLTHVLGRALRLE